MASAETLAARIRAKYPGAYDDLSDSDLEAKFDAKFPGVYDDLPRTSTKSAAESYRPSFQGGGPSAPVIPGESKFPVGEYASAGLSGLGTAASVVLPFAAPALAAGMTGMSGAALRAATGPVGLGVGAGALEYAKTGDPVAAVREGVQTGLLRKVGSTAARSAAAEVVPIAKASTRALGTTKVIGRRTYEWGAQGWFEKSTSAASSVAKNAPAAAKAAKAAPTAQPTTEIEKALAQSIPGAVPPTSASVRLSRALNEMAKAPSEATRQNTVTALREAVGEWVKQGKPREEIIRILQRNDFHNQTKAQATAAVDAILGGVR